MAVEFLFSKEKRKIVTRLELKGGLGNQMFQYAAALAFSKKNNFSLVIDLSFLKNNREESITFTPRNLELDCFQGFHMDSQYNLQYKRFSKIINEENFNSTFFFDRIIGRLFLLNGYFQSEMYFSILKREINEIFKVKEELMTEEILLQVSEFTNVESVAIHVRRGDYLKSEVLKYHGVCSAEYYQSAISHMNLKINSPKYFIFSEDTDWVKKEILPVIPESVLIESNIHKPSWLDLHYMSKCKHNIIANSTYSWWGAYLNNNPTKNIIAPKKWYQDEILNKTTTELIPKSWIRI